MPPPPPLRPLETILHPSPFVESEPNRLIITTQRIMQIADEGRKEMEARNITFSGRQSERPLIPLAIVFALIALPFLIVGAVKFMKLKKNNGFTAPPSAKCGDRPKPQQAATEDKDAKDPRARKKKKKKDPPKRNKTKEEIAWEEACALKKQQKRQSWGVIGLAVVGAIFGYVAYKGIKKEQHYALVVAGPGNSMKIPAKDENELNQILTMVQGAQKSAMAMPPPAA